MKFHKSNSQSPVKAKKHLGQHFLIDLGIAQDIVQALIPNNTNNVLEIGPGTGVLSQYIISNINYLYKAVELDMESVHYLKNKYKGIDVLATDFLTISLDKIFDNKPFNIIGNFPYNISSQIFFHVLDHKDHVTQVVCMLQKEVAERLCSGSGNKDYGILSVFLQAYYDCEYLFTVHEHVFDPPPKVKSGVIRIKRNNVVSLNCNEILFRKVVKQSFAMRRKTLRNCLKPLNLSDNFLSDNFYNKRAEELGVQDFVWLTNEIENNLKKN